MFNENPEKIISTLVLLVKESPRRILLGWKTEKFCKDHWVAYGGRLEAGETLRHAAARELREESGIAADERDLEKCAIISFHNLKNGKPVIVEVHVYIARRWEGEPQETDPAIINHTWFDADALPERIPLADKEWMPMVLRGKRLVGEAWYAEGNVDEYARGPVWNEVALFVEAEPGEGSMAA